MILGISTMTPMINRLPGRGSLLPHAREGRWIQSGLRGDSSPAHSGAAMRSPDVLDESRGVDPSAAAWCTWIASGMYVRPSRSTCQPMVKVGSGWRVPPSTCSMTW